MKSINHKIKIIPLALTISFLILGFGSVAWGSPEYYVENSSNCPNIYNGQKCEDPTKICGLVSGIVQCENPNDIIASTTYNPSYQDQRNVTCQDTGVTCGVGYIYDCHQSTAQGTFPKDWDCQQDSTCYSTNHRQTRCISTTTVECGSCLSGWVDCTDDGYGDGATTTCDIQAGTTECNTATGVPGTINASCICQPEITTFVGQVGINTSAPNAILDVRASTTIPAFTVIQDSTGNIVEIKDATTSVFIISDGGNITVAGDILPATTTSYDLGSESFKWANFYVGTATVDAFKMPPGASEGYYLISDISGVGTWRPSPTGTVPGGTTGQTLRNDGTSWIANSFLYNTGSVIGIGTTSTSAILTVAGDGLFEDILTVNTTNLPQLLLRYGDDNHLSFSVTSTQAEISASSTIIIDSLTGEIRTGANVTLFNASGTEMRATTFVSAANDSTVRKSGELVLRSSVPIFGFPTPAQTASTTFNRVSSNYCSSAIDSAPSALPGTTRKYAFLINFADNISTTTSSSWRVYRPIAATTSQSFEFSGQNLSSLTEGTPHLSSFFTLPDNDWQLDVKTPSGETIRIFSIFFLICDEIQ